MDRRSFLLKTALLGATILGASRASFALSDRTTASPDGAGAATAIDIRAYGALAGDVDADQARRNAAAIEQAIFDAARAGDSGVVKVPKGLFLVHLDPADYVEARSAYRTAAIRCAVGDVTIEGEGAGRTTLRAFHDGRDGYGYSVLQIGVPPLDNGNSDISGLTLRGMTLDGRHFHAMPGNHRPGLPVSHSLIRVEGMRRCVFADLYLRNAGGYAIGLQNGGYIENRFERIAIRNTMADGIDVKDNGSVSTGNVMSSVSVERFGLATLPEHPFAGIDLMGRSWTLDTIRVSRWGREGSPAAGLRFKQGAAGAGRGLGAVTSSARGVRISGPDPQASAEGDPRAIIGVHVKCEDVSLSDVDIKDVAVGIVVSQPRCTISTFSIRATNIGIVQRARENRTQEFDGADDITLTHGSIHIDKASGVGLDLRRPGAVVRGVTFDVVDGAASRANSSFVEDGSQFSSGTEPPPGRLQKP